jgi:hypothetical protein
VLDVRRATAAPLILYGLRCTWWGSPSEAHRFVHLPSPHGWLYCPLDLCPNCHGPTLPHNANDWRRALDDTADPYRAAVRWGRGQCYPDPDALIAAYQARAGQTR